MVILLVQEKKFVMYEYLLFFWKKKMTFIIVPVIFALIGAGASFVVPKDADYVGNTTIFTGTIKLGALSNPENVAATYGTDVEGEIEGFVSSDNYMKFKIYDDDRDRLEADLDKMTKKVEEALLESYESRSKATIAYRDKLIAQETELGEVLRVYSERLQNSDLTIEQELDTNAIVQYTEQQLADVIATAQRITNDIEFFEQPSIVTQSVSETKSYTMEYAVAGLILGVLMAFLILILWKYIIDARRYHENH